MTKSRKELGKEQSRSQEFKFKDFVDCSKTTYKKPRHTVCFNPKNKQQKPPNPIWLNRKVREIPTPNLFTSARNKRLNTRNTGSNGGFEPGWHSLESFEVTRTQNCRTAGRGMQLLLWKDTMLDKRITIFWRLPPTKTTWEDTGEQSVLIPSLEESVMNSKITESYQ